MTGYWRTPRLHEQVVKDISNGEMLNKKETHDKTCTINKWSLNNTQMIYNKEKDIGSSLICLLITELLLFKKSLKIPKGYEKVQKDKQRSIK